ncbi:MAG TPA: monothiol bacilliredoxin BrxC family protein [Fibrobacteria bacterium]|nr:monothiol bacilliredoxin BrxC family protein [Fibrobacteria bacterium]
MVQEIRTLEEMDALLAGPDPVLLFKYSPTCGISQVAQEAWEAFQDGPRTVLLAQCDVLEAKPAARGISELIHVAHQSPQVLALLDGRCIAHASHYSIKTSWLAQAEQKLLTAVQAAA